MRIMGFLLEKEFKQIFRNPTILIMIIAMPLIQLLVLPLAANYEIKNINVVVVDHDHSAYSRALIAKISASRYFNLIAAQPGYERALTLIEANTADLILEFPQGFERKLVREQQTDLLMALNAINGMKAQLGGLYLKGILEDFNTHINIDLAAEKPPGASWSIKMNVTNWFNPLQLYELFMVPGILAFLVTMVTGLLAAMNIVKEKEEGTLEQVNVSPIRKHHFILGKLLPFWLIGNVVFGLGLLISYWVYGIVPVGSLWLLFFFLWVYLLAVLGFGLLISTYCHTQQQAMLLCIFFMMIFILMGGLLTAIDAMPAWARVIAALNPVTYIVEVVRMVVLKGSGFSDVLPQLGIVTLFALVLNAWAIWNYRKVG